MLPTPRPQIAPQYPVVNLLTFLWLTSPYAPVTVNSAAGGTAASVTATPRQVGWNMGERSVGGTVTCAGPGTPFNFNVDARNQTTTCGWTYQHSSAGLPGNASTIVVSVVYDVRWRASDGTTGTFGTRTATAQLQVEVDEIQTVNGPVRP